MGMEIRNEFSLGLPPERAYALLLDLEQVTPCLPGAELGEERDDGARAVKVTVKLGPMRFVYDGTVRIADKDDATRRAVMVGTARESRGQGNAEATITMTVSEEGSGSKVEAVADVGLTGRAAQMGRGVVDDVARRMIADMAKCLESRFASEPAATSGDVGGRPDPAPPAPPAQPVRAGSLLVSVLWGRITGLLRRR